MMERTWSRSTGPAARRIQRRAQLFGIVAGTIALLFAGQSAPAGAATFGEGFGIEPGSFYAGTCQLPAVTGGESSAQEAREKRDCHETSALAPETAVPVTQAGAHPDGTTTFAFNPTSFFPGAPAPEGNVRNVVVDLPPGFVGNPTAVPTCPQATFALGKCPVDTQVGTVELRLSGLGAETGEPTTTFHNPQECSFTFQPFMELPQFKYPDAGPLYPEGEPRCYYPINNVAPAQGELANVGFTYYAPIAVGLEPVVRTDGDYGLQLRLENIPQAPGVSLSTATLWGVPGSPSHDGFRFNPNFLSELVPPQPWPASDPVKPFLTNPTRCSGEELESKLYVDSWQEPGTKLADGSPNLSDPAWHSYVSKAPAVTGCEKVPFEPGIRLQPTSKVAESPTGLAVSLEIPQKGQEEAGRLGTANLKDTVVTLPSGLTLTPAAANGLGSCGPAEIGLLTANGAMPSPIRFDQSFPTGCPDSSKLGAVSIETPLLSEAIPGEIYLASQKENPFGSNFAIYLVAHSDARNLTVKLAGEVRTAPDGQLTATFRNNPQVPFSKLSLRFKGGSQAPLVTPATCGVKTTVTEFTSWAQPETPVAREDQMSVEAGANGSPCVTGEAELPRGYGFDAGTVNAAAGAYSPFVLKLSRDDGTQRLQRVDVTLPEGLTGRLAGIPYCSEGELAKAATRSGREEQAQPSCGSASLVGHVTVGAGAGPEPLYVEGDAYLAGPYKGAPLSLAIVTPAVAGPFDLGTVVVRVGLFVDPMTTRITAKSDPLPTVLEGVPLDIRSIVLRADRPEFTLNPTNCNAKTVRGDVASIFEQGDSLLSRFQVGGCKALSFKPRLALRVLGKTNRNTKPRLRAVLQATPGEANISRAQVNLPSSEFLEQSHIRTVCTRVQWGEGDGNGSACPKGSVYGRAKAWTPLLDKPLEGNVYLRSNGGERQLPDLVAALNGQVDIAVWGKVDAGPNQGLRNTFELLPDAPVSKFILEMKGGSRGLLVNSEDLCSKQAKTQAIVRLTGQNGAVRHFKPRVANDCKKKLK